VALTRPQNLKEMLTKGQFGRRAIPLVNNPTMSVVKRPITTYDRNQMGAPIKACLFQCNNHFEMHENFNNLNQAVSSTLFEVFSSIHDQCGGVRILPVVATHNTSIKCTECNYRTDVCTNKRKSRLELEMRNICETTQRALLRQCPTHSICSTKCKICTLAWQSPQFIDPHGTRYRLLSFNCNMTNCIYIIHCLKCNINYVGMTSNSIKQRMNNHISAIRTWKNTSVPSHFMDASHSIENDFRIGIIDHAPGDVSILRIREGFWIYALQTVTKGINAKEEANLTMDYKLINYSKHIHHSKTCTPYFIHHLQSTHTDQLKPYRRCMIKPRGRGTASALRGKTQQQYQRRTANDIRRHFTQTVHTSKDPLHCVRRKSGVPCEQQS
jgi:hypothetical protein